MRKEYEPLLIVSVFLLVFSSMFFVEGTDIYTNTIKILNIQSYPKVGDNWTVEFITEGQADLTITPTEGTLFGDDLEFLELWCGETRLEPDFEYTNVLYENYECSDKGKEVSKVLTGGKHTLEFQYGDVREYAYNDATCGCNNCSSCYTALDNVSCQIVELSNNITNTSTCINDPADFNDKVLDCKGYYINGSDSGSGIILDQQINATIRGCGFTGFAVSINMTSTNESTFYNNTIHGGILIKDSKENKYEEMRFYNGTQVAQIIELQNSHGNQFVHFSVTSNLVGGFAAKCDNNTIENATINCGGTGIGINISGNNTNTTIINVTVSGCDYGIVFQGNVTNSSVKDSTIENNSLYGFYLEDLTGDLPMNNTFYNNYFNNSENVYTNNESIVNYWNITKDCSSGTNIVGGPCLGGNFWSQNDSDGNFSDSCIEKDSDGICDSSYETFVNNTDYLPLTYTMPSVYPEYPVNGTTNTTTRTPDFIFNVSGWVASDYNCTLYLNNGTPFDGENNDSAWNDTSTTLAPLYDLIDDNYIWWVECIDNNQNTTNVSVSWDLDIQFDTTPPNWSWEQPTNISFTQNEDWVFFNGTGSEAPNGCLLDVNDTTNYTMTVSSNDCEYNLSSQTNLTTLCGRIWINDTLGNLNASSSRCVSINISQDLDPPSIDVVNPLNGTTNNSKFDLNLTIDENTNFCQYNIDSGSNTTMLNDSMTNWFIEVTPSSDGTRQLFIYCNDTTGNLGINNSVFVDWNTTSPYFSWDQPNNNTITQNEDWIFFNGTATETPDGCLLEVNDTTNYTMTVIGNDCRYNLSSQTNLTTLCGVVWFNNSLGNLNMTGSRCVTINISQDLTPPLLDFTTPTPSNNTYTQNQDWVYFNVTSDEQLNYCWLDNSTTNITMTVNNNYCYYNLTGQSNNTEVYSWVYANDTTGNWNFSYQLNITINISQDLDPPSIDVVNPLNGTNNNSQFDLNVTVNESADYCQYNIDSGSNTTMFNDSMTNWFIEVTPSSDGTRQLFIYCNDTSGNLALNNSVFIDWDTTGPSWSWDQPTNISFTQNEDWIFFNGTGLDTPSGCLLDINDTTNYTMTVSSNDCEYNLTSQTNLTTVCGIVWINDSLGNLNSSSSRCISINISQDLTPPLLDFTTPTPTNNTYTQNQDWVYFNVTSDEQLNYCWLDNGASNTTMTVNNNYCYYNLTGQSNNTEVYSWVYANDTTGNWNFSYQLNVTINISQDLDPPSIDVFNPLNGTSNNSKFDLNVTVNESADYCQYNIDSGSNTTMNNDSMTNWFIEVTPSSDGTRQLFIYCNDTSGNLALNNTVFIDWDTTGPSWSWEQPTNISFTQNEDWIFFNGTGLETPDGCLLEVNDTTNYTMIVSSNDCEYNLTSQTNLTTVCGIVWINDSLGNLNSSSSRCISINISQDLTPPSIDVVNPLNGTTNNSKFDLNLTIDENTNFCQYNIDSGSNTTMLNDSMTNWFIEVTPSSDGTRQLIIYCNDTTGNLALNNTVFIDWDTTQPTLDYTTPTPSNNTYTQNQDWVFFNVTSGEQLNYCWLDNGASNTTMTVNGDYCYYNVSSQSNNTEINRWVWGNDTAGNWNLTENLNVTINLTLDTNAPQITVDFPLNQTYSTTIINLNITVNEVAVYCQYALDSGSNTTMLNDTTTNWFIEMTPSEGLHNISIYCNDTDANLGFYGDRWFTRDVHAPIVNLEYPPTNTTNTTDTTPDFIFNVTDNVSSTFFCEVFFTNGSWYYIGYNDTTLNDTSTTITSNLTLVEDSQYYEWWVRCFDDANMGTSTYWYLFIDTSPPAMTIESPLNASYTTQIIDLNVTTNESSGGCMYNLDGGSNTSLINDSMTNFFIEMSPSDGFYQLDVYCNDTAGFLINNGSIGFTKDTSAPIWSGNNTNNTASYSASTLSCINITWQDSNSDLDTVLVQGNWSGSDANYSASNETAIGFFYCNVMPAGSWYWQAWANDTNGFMNSTGQWEFEISRATTIITLAINGSSADSYSEMNNYVNFSVYLSHSQSPTVYLYQDGLQIDTGSAPLENISYYYANATHNITANFSQSQNYTFAEVYYNLTITDDSPPSVTVTSPTNTSYNTTIDLNVTTNKTTTVVCYYQMDSGAATNLSNSSSTNWFTELTPLDNLHNLTVYCNDSAGNLNNDSTIWFTLDTAHPRLENLTNLSIGINTAVLKWDTNESTTSVLYYTINESNFNQTFTNSTLDTNHTAYITSLYTNTTYYYNYSSCDVAGNCNTSATYNFSTLECPDSDGDGYTDEACGGNDCNDSSSSINPGANDICGNNIDEDCSGLDEECPDSPVSSSGSTTTTSTDNSYTKTYTAIFKTTGAIINVNKEAISVKKIEIEVVNQANNVKITITKIDSKPPSITHSVTGKTYQYMDIGVTNLDDDDIENATMNFKVEKTWINSNNINKTTVVLNRYLNAWKKLNTTLASEDTDYIYYDAQTPGFSYFVISGDEVVSAASDNQSQQNQTQQICTPEAVRCIDNRLEKCSIDGSKWGLFDECEYGCVSSKCRETPLVDYTPIIALIVIIIIILVIVATYRIKSAKKTAKKPSKPPKKSDKPSKPPKKEPPKEKKEEPKQEEQQNQESSEIESYSFKI